MNIFSFFYLLSSISLFSLHIHFSTCNSGVTITVRSNGFLSCSLPMQDPLSSSLSLSLSPFLYLYNLTLFSLHCISTCNSGFTITVRSNGLLSCSFANAGSTLSINSCRSCKTINLTGTP